jgi:hypothetical protein
MSFISLTEKPLILGKLPIRVAAVLYCKYLKYKLFALNSEELQK